MAGTIPDELLLSRIRKEAAAREAAIAALYAALDAANAETQEKITVAASRLSAQIAGRTVNASAIAGTILRTQVEEGFALAQQVTALEARVTDNENTAAASITEIRSVVATEFESQAQQILTLKAVFNGNIATLTENLLVVSNATSAVAVRTTTLESTVNNPTTGVVATSARLTTEETTRATADTALASRATTLEATVNNPTTGVAATSARLTTEETTRATADSALASRTTTLESQVQTPTTGLLARVSTVESTKVDASGAYAQANSAISASLSSGSAGTIGAAINTEASARATADGNLSGKYSLKVTAGNIVTGMNITSSTGGGTDVSDVTFQASSFKIYNGSTATAPFSVSGGVVYMDDAVIRSTIEVGSGDTRLYKPVTGAMTFGNTSQGHISLENYAVGTAAIRAKYGSGIRLDMRSQFVAGGVVGAIYVYSIDGTSFLSIAGAAVAGSYPVISWNDAVLYRYTAGTLKTDTDFIVGGGFTFRNCPLKQQVGKSHVVSLAGGSAEETFNVDISGFGFTAKPTAGSCECASDKDYKARYDWDAAGNSSTNAVIKVSRFDGANTSAATLRFSLIFIQ